MQVRAGHLAGASALGYQVSRADKRSLFDSVLNQRKVRVKACHSPAVVNLNPLSVDSVLPRSQNCSAFARKDGGAFGNGHVDAPVELNFSASKRVVPLAVAAGNSIIFNRQAQSGVQEKRALRRREFLARKKNVNFSVDIIAQKALVFQ